MGNSTIQLNKYAHIINVRDNKTQEDTAWDMQSRFTVLTKFACQSVFYFLILALFIVYLT